MPSQSPELNQMQWSVEERGSIIVVRTHGVFNLNDHRVMVRDIIERPFWRPGRDVLFDHRSLSFEGTGYEAMWNAVQVHQEYDARIGDGRAAVLMGNAADFGVGRIFDNVAADHIHARVHIFRDETAALEWLAAHDNAQPP